MDTIPERTPSMLEDPPQVDLTAATRLLQVEYGIDAEVSDLRSERDRNFLAEVPDGRRLVIKVSNSGDDPDQIAMESAAMHHVEVVDPDLPIPRVLTSLDGRSVVTVDAADGRTHLVRVMTVMPGDVADLTALPGWFAADFGAVSARLTRALQGFGHPAAYRRLDWDPRIVTTLRPYADRLPDERRRGPMHRLLDRFEGLDAATRELPGYVLHGDVTLSNVLLQDGGITGVIDFGDMHHTARVAELAISLTSLLRESDDLWGDAGRFLDGYQRVLPLEPAEVALIGELRPRPIRRECADLGLACAALPGQRGVPDQPGRRQLAHPRPPRRQLANRPGRPLPPPLRHVARRLGSDGRSDLAGPTSVRARW